MPEKQDTHHQSGSIDLLFIVQEGKKSSSTFAQVPLFTFIRRDCQSKPARKSGLYSGPTFFALCNGWSVLKKSRRHKWVRCGWLIQLWLRLFLLSVHHPQVNSRFTFCDFFSMGRWVFLPSSSLGLQKIYRLLNRTTKVRSYYSSTLHCHLGSPCLFFTSESGGVSLTAVSYNQLQAGSCHEALLSPTQIFHPPERLRKVR